MTAPAPPRATDRRHLSLRQGRRHRLARRRLPGVRPGGRPLRAGFRRRAPGDRRQEGDEPALRDREHADADRREGGSSAPLRASEIEASRARWRARSAPAGARRVVARECAQPQKWIAADRQGSAGAPRTLARRRRRLSAGGVHALAHADEPGARQRRHRRSPTRRRSRSTRPISSRRFASSSQAMDAGQVDLLVILGGNPVFTAPADLQFQERLAKVGAVGLTTRCTTTRRRPIATGTFPRRTPSRAGATRARSTAPSRSCSR